MAHTCGSVVYCLGVSWLYHHRSLVQWLRCPASSQRTWSVLFFARLAASTGWSWPSWSPKASAPAATGTKSTKTRRLTRRLSTPAMPPSGLESLLVSPMFSVASVLASWDPLQPSSLRRMAQPSSACLSLSSLLQLSASMRWSLALWSTPPQDHGLYELNGGVHRHTAQSQSKTNGKAWSWKIKSYRHT